MLHRQPQYCPACGKQLESLHKKMPSDFVGDTFIGYKPCDCKLRESGVEPESKGEETKQDRRRRFYDFLQSDRLFFVDEVRHWLKLLVNEQVSVSKFVELFNEKVFEKYHAKASLQQPTYSLEQVLELLRKITEEAFQVGNYDVWEVMVEGKLKKYSSEKLLDKFLNK